MSALESEADPENKIPSFIQVFLTYADFLDYFVENYEGDSKPFEKSLWELDIDYTKNFGSEGSSVIKVIHQDEQLHKAIKIMLDYHILMAPIVENMENKRTIGFFFLKDVFWILRNEKFEYLDKPVIHLLQTIYNYGRECYSASSSEEAEENEGEGEDLGANDEEAKIFLEDMEWETDSQNIIDNTTKFKSFALDGIDESNIKFSSTINVKNNDIFSSQVNIKNEFNEGFYKGLNEEIPSAAKSKDISSESQDESSRISKLFQYKQETSDPSIAKEKKGNSEYDKISKRLRAHSTNSYTNEIVSK